MKFLVLSLLSLLILSPSTIAGNKTISCQWQESTSHAPSFYREAEFSFELTKTKLIVSHDTFLNRRYTPCWIGNYSSCSFGFDYDRTSDWTVIFSTPNSIKVEAPGFYWSAELELNFSKNLTAMATGDHFSMSMSGDDGDGVMFQNETFACQLK